MLAYIVEAFAKLGCDSNTMQAGGAVPEVRHLAVHKQLVSQFYHIPADGHLISATNGGFFRSIIPVDDKHAENLY